MDDEEEVQASRLVPLRSCDPLPLVVDGSKCTHKQLSPPQTAMHVYGEGRQWNKFFMKPEMKCMFPSYCSEKNKPKPSLADIQTSGFSFMCGATGEDCCTIMARHIMGKHETLGTGLWESLLLLHKLIFNLNVKWYFFSDEWISVVIMRSSYNISFWFLVKSGCLALRRIVTTNHIDVCSQQPVEACRHLYA